MNGELNTACIIQHAKVLEKGFTETNIPTLLMLTVSELGEALEADRKDHHANRERFEYAKKHLSEPGKCYHPSYVKQELKRHFEEDIKNSFEDEIADTFLRLMDICGAYNIDIEYYIRQKQAYNELRDYKFGKRY